MIWNMHPLYPIQISRYLSISKLFRTVPIPPRWRLRHPRSKGPKGSCDWYILGSEDKMWWHAMTPYVTSTCSKKSCFLLKLMPCPSTPHFPDWGKNENEATNKNWGGIFVPCDTSKKKRAFIKQGLFSTAKRVELEISRVSSTKRFNKMDQKSCLRFKKR